jgi:hypothetical protein
MKQTFKKGTKVTWKASGKGARCDGVSGQWVTGTVEDFTTLDFIKKGKPTTIQCADIRVDYKSLCSIHVVDLKSLKKVST